MLIPAPQWRPSRFWVSVQSITIIADNDGGMTIGEPPLPTRGTPPYLTTVRGIIGKHTGTTRTTIRMHNNHPPDHEKTIPIVIIPAQPYIRKTPVHNANTCRHCAHGEHLPTMLTTFTLRTGAHTCTRLCTWWLPLCTGVRLTVIRSCSRWRCRREHAHSWWSCLHGRCASGCHRRTGGDGNHRA